MTDKTDISRADAALEALESYQQADEEGIMVLTSRQAIHEVADAYRALRDALDAAQSERVKPLEWQEIANKTWLVERPAVFTEYDYRIVEEWFDVDGYGYKYQIGATWHHGFASLEDAKAAAQADYERRILSALQPAPSEWNAAIEAAALRVDCNCNEMCQFGRCPKPIVKNILALKRPDKGDGV